jgi:hypothetical protein
MLRYSVVIVGLALLLPASGSFGQERPDPAKVRGVQQDAMKRLAMMDGVWRGSGWVLSPSGEKSHFTQTERIGPFLDGTLKVIEGRGYADDGTVTFNAFAIISYDAKTDAFTMRSYAQGHAGDFPITPNEHGFQWEIPAGPMTIRYSAEIKDGAWKETGDRIPKDGEPIRFIEMTLARVGDTDWPAAGAVGPE